MGQKWRNDAVGDVARDASKDQAFPRGAKCLSLVLDHLEAMNACPGAESACRRAWREYLFWNKIGTNRLGEKKAGSEPGLSH